jgi:nitroreductase
MTIAGKIIMEKVLKNSFLQLVQSRRSIRKFKNIPIERDKIVTCIEAARLAPSAENVQPWRFIVLDEPETITSFSEQAFSGIYRFTRWAARAPVIIAICAQLDVLANRLGKQIQGTHYYLIDIGIAGEHLVLQAREFGIGSCWIGWFDAKKVKKFLAIPGSWKVVQLLALGYPEENLPAQRTKKSLKEILYFNQYKK